MNQTGFEIHGESTVHSTRITGYLMEHLVKVGLLPANLREWAEDQQWAIPIMPTFRPANQGYWADSPLNSGTDMVDTSDPGQAMPMLVLRIPTQPEPKPGVVTALYRIAVLCPRPTCRDDRLKWVLEFGKDWYALACPKCCGMVWRREHQMNPITLQMLYYLSRDRVLRNLVERRPDEGWTQR